MKDKIARFYNIFSQLSFLILLYGIGIFLPLYFQNHYFDIMEAKAYGYYLVIRFFFIFALITFILKIICKDFNKNYLFLRISLILFLIATCVSSFLSRSLSNAISGLQGWYIGLFTIGTLIFMILIFKDTKKISFYFYIPVIMTIAFVYILTILHSFEIDLLDLHNNILVDSYHKYLSTIGNINWYAGYLSLTVPLFVCQYLKEENKTKTVIYAVMSFLGVLSISFLGSDSIYLALGFMSFFVIPYLFWEKQHIKRFSYIIIVYICGLLTARYLDYCMDGFSAITRQYKFILPCFVVAICLYVISVDLKNRKFQKYRKTIIIAIETALFIALIGFVTYAFLNNGGDWATGRGALWEETLKIYSNFSLKRKLFGLGPEMLNNAYANFNNKYHALYLTSHSEPIQLLATLGICGLITWIMCWGYFFVNFFKTKAWKDSKLIPIYISLFAYFGQALLNSSTTLNVATLSLLVIGYCIYSK